LKKKTLKRLILASLVTNLYKRSWGHFQARVGIIVVDVVVLFAIDVAKMKKKFRRLTRKTTKSVINATLRSLTTTSSMF
jgi:hypothetical protein